MKGLFKFISPFAPDQSGAVSVLFPFSALIVICDAGGCAGNICGFDEPRWFSRKGSVFSAGLRDLDAILGRDEKLAEKLRDAFDSVPAGFAAIIGTPVPAVIGTDFRALRSLSERKLGVPVISLDTTGIKLYDDGEEKAYAELFKTFAEERAERRFDIGVIGATPLNVPGKSYCELLAGVFGKENLSCTFFDGEYALEDVRAAGAAKANLVFSPSGVKAAKYLKEKFGTPYVVGAPITEIAMTRLAVNLKDEIYCDVRENGNTNPNGKERVLIMYQQFAANAIREELEEKNGTVAVDVATWFKLDKSYARKNDVRLAEEDDFVELVKTRGYKNIIADPVFRRALRNTDAELIPLPHFPVSGELHSAEAETDFENLRAKLS